jgi:AcrR family transcriptional regulator
MSKKERREQILVSARKVFAEKGYREAKVGDIASAANVAKGTVNLYFKDKRSIFMVRFCASTRMATSRIR